MMISSALYMTLLVVTIVYGYVLSKRAITSVLKSVADTGAGTGPEPAAGGGSGVTDVEMATAGKG